MGLAVIALLAGVIAYLFTRKFHLYLFCAAMLFFLIARLQPALLRPLFVLFSYIGYGMGWVMTRVILTLVFFIILVPIGLFSRLLGKKFLDCELRKESLTYWIERGEIDRKSFERQY